MAEEEWIPLTKFVRDYMWAYRSEPSVRNDAVAGRIDAEKDGRNWRININGAKTIALIQEAEKAQYKDAEQRRKKREEMAATAKRLEESEAWKAEKSQLTQEIQRLNEQIQTLNDTIANKNKTIDTLKNSIDNMERNLAVATARYEAAEHMASLFTAQLSSNTRTPTKSRNNESKKQAKNVDLETLQGWEQWQAEHEQPKLSDYAESIGIARTTVIGRINRARKRQEQEKQEQQKR